MLPTLLSLSSFAAVVVPQRADIPPVPALAPRAALLVQEQDGVLWVKGRDYKLAFDGALVRFHAVHGAVAARSLPLGLRLSAVQCGGVPLALGSRTQRSVDRDDRLCVVTLDHGAVREVWRLDLEQAEQDFVFDDPPASDLVVRLEVVTGLGAGVPDAAGGLCFTDRDGRGVRYGEALVHDAAGNRHAMPSEWRDGGIELRVPREFVAAARGPLTIDPVLTRLGLTSTARVERNADVVHEPSSDTWLVVYEEVVSSSDTDVVSQRLSSTGAVLDTVAVDVSTSDSIRPKVAANAAARQFLVVWLDGGVAARHVFGRFRSSTDTSQSGLQTIAILPGVASFGAVDVGGSSRGGPTYCVVWSVVTPGVAALRALRVDSDGRRASDFEIEDSLLDPAQLAISDDLGDGARWMIGYAVGSTARSSIRAALVDGVGNLGDVDFPVSDTVGVHVLPSVAGDGDEFLVVWQAGDTDTNVRGRQLIQRGGLLAAVAPSIDLTLAEPGARPALAQTEPRVAGRGCRFVYSYVERDTRLNEVFAAVLHGRPTLSFVEGHTPLTTGPGVWSNGGLADSRAPISAARPPRALGVFTAGDVAGALLDPGPPVGRALRAELGCGGAREPDIAIDAEPVIGEELTITLTPAGVGSPQAAIMLGFPAPALPLCPAGCDLGLTPLDTISGTSLRILVPCDLRLLDAVVAVQGFEVSALPSTGSCGPPTYPFFLRVSDRLTLTFR